MKIPWQIITIVALAVVVLVLIFFPKSCRVDDLENKIDRVEEDIRQKEAEAATLQAKAERLQKKWVTDSLDRIASEKAYKSKIAVLEKKVAEKRKIAEPIINSNDTIRQLIQAMDSVHAAQAARINQLNDEVRIQALVCRDLTAVKVKELAIVQAVSTDKNTIIESQAKVIKKLKAGRVLRNIAIPVLTVGAFLLGVVSVD